MGRPIMIQGEQCYDKKLGYYYDYSKQIDEILQNASSIEKHNGKNDIHLKHTPNTCYRDESVVSNIFTPTIKYSDRGANINYTYLKNKNYNSNIYSKILFYEIHYKEISYHPIRKTNAINFMSLKS